MLVLSAADFEDIASKDLWFRRGVKDRLRFLPVHDVCQNLSNRVLKALLAFHALTGCDTTSAFSGIGKKKPWNVFIRSAVNQESLTILGQKPEVDEDTSSFVKRSLTVRLYHQPLTACYNTSTVQTTRRTFGEKASTPYSSSHLPRYAGGKKKMMSDAKADVQGPGTYQPIGAYDVYLQEERVQQQLFLCKCRSLKYRSLHLYGGGHM